MQQAQAADKIWLVVETKRLREIRETDRDSLVVDLYVTDEPPISNDAGLIQIPITELLHIAENSAFNADKDCT